MKTRLIDKNGKEISDIELPKNFSSKIRADILQKVFEAKKLKQPTGTKIGAGAGYSASGIIKHRRHAWKTAYGKGISRIPRKILSRHGASFNWVGATIASTRGGRRAHPAKAEKNQFKKINKKELLIAFNSGFSGSVNPDLIKKKYGFVIKSGFVFDSSVLKLKSKEFFQLLKNFLGSLEKVLKNKKIRAGKGKLRGRKYKSNRGLLLIIGSNEKMRIGGIDVVNVNNLKISDLAPNGVTGRITYYTEKSIKEIGERFK